MNPFADPKNFVKPAPAATPPSGTGIPCRAGGHKWPDEYYATWEKVPLKNFPQPGEETTVWAWVANCERCPTEPPQKRNQDDAESPLQSGPRSVNPADTGTGIVNALGVERDWEHGYKLGHRDGLEMVLSSMLHVVADWGNRADHER